MRRPYQFALLRFVFNQAAAEFVNVGVVLRALDDGHLYYVLSDRFGRLSAFFRDGFEGATFRSALETARARFDAVTEQINREGRADLFSKSPQSLSAVLPHLLAFDSTALQWSEVMGGASEDPSRAVVAIFRDFVERHETQRERHHQSEKDIWQIVRRHLQDSQFATDPRLRFPAPIRGQEREWTFRVGWPNGVPQVCDTIAFDLANADNVIEKAETWRGRLDALADTEVFRATIITGAPKIPTAAKAFAAAVQILKKAGPVRAVVAVEESRGALLEMLALDLAA